MQFYHDLIFAEFFNGLLDHYNALIYSDIFRQKGFRYRIVRDRTEKLILFAGLRGYR
jgi:hypothetical protein